jgi:hypothetical protein
MVFWEVPEISGKHITSGLSLWKEGSGMQPSFSRVYSSGAHLCAWWCGIATLLFSRKIYLKKKHEKLFTLYRSLDANQVKLPNSKEVLWSQKELEMKNRIQRVNVKYVEDSYKSSLLISEIRYVYETDEYCMFSTAD